MQGPFMAGPPPWGQFRPVTPLGAPAQDIPFFDLDNGTLNIPPAATGGKGLQMKAFPVSPQQPADISEERLQTVVEKLLSGKNDKNSVWSLIVDDVKEEIKRHQKEEETKFNNMWFELKPNTFSTAIWALLVLDFDASRMQSLSLHPNNNHRVPYSQRWELWGRQRPKWQRRFWSDPDEKKMGVGDYIIWLPYWFWYRFWPWFSALMFQITSIFLFSIAVLIQFGFTFLLYMSLEMPDFNSPGVEYICTTTGWLQLISIGFFCAYMLGEVPRLFKTQLLIWFSEYETSTDRGQAECKKLWATEDELVNFEYKSYYIDEEDEDEQDKRQKHPSNEYHLRSGFWLVFRRILATIVNLADLAITGFVLFVGVRYIFWSGYKSMDPAYLSDQKFSPFNEDTGFPVEDGAFPWMSNTQGIEEVIMATLALVFIMDIDELLFAFLLPRSVQQVVTDCRLSSVMWMPSTFDADAFKELGLPATHVRLFQQYKATLSKDLHPQGQHGTPPTGVQAIAESLEKAFDKEVQDFKAEYKKYDTVAKSKNPFAEAKRKNTEAEPASSTGDGAVGYKNFLSDWKAGMKQQDQGLSEANEENYRNRIKKQLKLFSPLYREVIEEYPKHKADTVTKKSEDRIKLIKKRRKGFVTAFQNCLTKAQDQEKLDHFNASWMKVMPFATVSWILLLISVGFSVVLMVRHYEGCATFGSREMPDMPTFRTNSTYSDEAAYTIATGPGGGVAIVFVLLLFYEFFFHILPRRDKHPGRGISRVETPKEGNRWYELPLAAEKLEEKRKRRDNELGQVKRKYADEKAEKRLEYENKLMKKNNEASGDRDQKLIKIEQEYRKSAEAIEDWWSKDERVNLGREDGRRVALEQEYREKMQQIENEYQSNKWPIDQSYEEKQQRDQQQLMREYENDLQALLAKEETELDKIEEEYQKSVQKLLAGQEPDPAQDQPNGQTMKSNPLAGDMILYSGPLNQPASGPGYNPGSAAPQTRSIALPPAQQEPRPSVSAAPQQAASSPYAAPVLSQDQRSVMQLAGPAEPEEWRQLRMQAPQPQPYSAQPQAFPAQPQAQPYPQPQPQPYSAQPQLQPSPQRQQQAAAQVFGQPQPFAQPQPQQAFGQPQPRIQSYRPSYDVLM